VGIGILFVDDEPDVLQGLRRSMKRNRKHFDMRFVEGGAQALEALENDPADIVISDMRMPGMDGGELLRQVRERFPGTIRMILSGYAESEAVMRTVGPAHQYLSKPCDAETLSNSINRALALRNHLESASLRSFITGLNRLPTLPEAVSELIEKLDSTDTDIESVAEIISRDISMTAQILKLTNSAYFTVAKSITTPKQAVQMLGFDTIKSLILVSGIFGMFPENPESTEIIHRLNERSLSIAILAKELAALEGLDALRVEQTGCAAVLSHIGTLAILHEDFERFNEAISVVENEGLDIASAERRIFGASHAELGAYLLGLWSFGDPVVEAVAYHHNPAQCPGREFNALTALYLAQHFSKALDGGVEMLPALEAKLDMDYLEQVGVAHRLPAWRELLTGRIRKRRQ